VSAVLLDTHVWAWSLTGHERISSEALTAIVRADIVYVSPITFFEIAQKVRLGKWPAMDSLVDRLPSLLADQGGQAAAFTPVIAVVAGSLDWPHRDPFDRFIAATALQRKLSLISADRVFDGIVERIW